MQIKTVCVYCASSQNIDQKYFDHAARLAEILVENNISVVFGGGSHGLMGKLADVVLAKGGTIKGIMPQFMDDVEWGHRGVTDFEYTTTMHERKARLLHHADALVTLAGGCGTLEELLEAITLKRLGVIGLPIVILNTDGFYDPLQTMLERCVEEGFMKPNSRQIWTFVDTPEQILPTIHAAEMWEHGAIKF